jgi:DNA-binding FrmR family transcriptional regulator
MAHALSDKQKLLNRVRRLRGQIDAIERAILADAPCGEVMRRVATVKGATTGLMAEVVDDHVRAHMIDPARTPSPSEEDAARELIAVLRSYIA